MLMGRAQKRYPETEYTRLVTAYRSAETKAQRDRAYEQILAGVEGIAVNAARSIRVEGRDVADLVQECFIHLMEAIDAYDPARGHFTGLYQLVCRRRLLTLRKYALKRGRRDTTVVSLDAARNEDGTNLHDICNDSPDPLEALDNREVSEKVMAFLQTRLSPIEWGVFSRYVTNRVEGRPDYATIAEWLKDNPPPGSKRNADPIKAIDNALMRARRKVHKYREEIAEMVGEEVVGC